MREVVREDLGHEASFTHFPIAGLCRDCAEQRLVLFAMHIPDGFLSGGVAAALAVVSGTVVLWALRVSDRNLTEAQVPLLGVVSAFVFAAQMLNFPIAGGTSGHFLGATLAAVLLGPAAACLVMSVVITIQALAFADGGISALGANVFNMGILGALIAGFLLAAAVRTMRPERSTYLGTVGVFAWTAVMVGALATSIELAVSGTIPLGTVLPPMLGVHALIGVGEAVITVAAVSAVLASRPDLVSIAPQRGAADPGRAAEVTA